MIQSKEDLRLYQEKAQLVLRITRKRLPAWVIIIGLVRE